MLKELEQKVLAYIEDDLCIIHRETGFEQFLVAGSWSSSIIAKVVSEWDRCEDLSDYNKLELIANDIDIYYGCFAHDEDVSFTVDMLGIKKHQVDKLLLELNTVECCNLSAAGFLCP